MPFSRPRTVIASRISRDMWLLLDEVGTLDLGVRDGDDAAVGGDRDLLVRGADELAGEGSVAVDGVAGAHAGMAAEEAAEGLGLGQRPLGPRRGALQGVALTQVGQRMRDALAEPERDAVGVVDEQPDGRSAQDLGEQHLDLGLADGEPSLDIGLDGAHGDLLLTTKKAGERPLPVLPPARSRCESCVPRIAARRRLPDRYGLRRAGARAIEVAPVVLALRPQAARERERLARLAVAPEQLQR